MYSLSLDKCKIDFSAFYIQTENYLNKTEKTDFIRKNYVKILVILLYLNIKLFIYFNVVNKHNEF